MFTFVGLVGIFTTILGIIRWGWLLKGKWNCYQLFLVPETKGSALAESVEDSVALIKDFKFFTWKTWEKNKKAGNQSGNDPLADSKF